MGLFRSKKIVGIAVRFTPLQNAIKIAQGDSFVTVLEALSCSIFTNLYNHVTLKKPAKKLYGFLS